jgi:hypothetical protein
MINFGNIEILLKYTINSVSNDEDEVCIPAMEIWTEIAR